MASENSGAKRADGMPAGVPFKKGVSPNPGGRPKAIKEVQALFRESTEAAYLRLVELMQGDDAKVAVAACREILDRGWGKPNQPVSGPDGQRPAVDLAPLLARLLNG